MAAEEVEVGLHHPVVVALVEGDPQAEVGAADTPQLPAQAVVASMEAAADANFQLSCRQDNAAPPGGVFLAYG